MRSQQSGICLSASCLLRPMCCFAEKLIPFQLFYCLKVDTVRAKNGSPVMKSHFLALAKEVTPSCLCSREEEEDSPSLPSRRCSRRGGLPPKAGTGRQEDENIPRIRHQVAKALVLFLQHKMNARFIARQDFPGGLTPCAALSVLPGQGTSFPGADLVLVQRHKGFLSSDQTVSKGSQQVAVEMADVI